MSIKHTAFIGGGGGGYGYWDVGKEGQKIVECGKIGAKNSGMWENRGKTWRNVENQENSRMWDFQEQWCILYK